MREAGFGVIFCNVRDFRPSEWDNVRTKAANAGVVCGPWLHTVNAAKNFSVELLGLLIDVADDWNSPLIVNSEKEIDIKGNAITKLIASYVGNRDAGISVQAWPFADVDWTPLSKYPILPQIFPVESAVSKNPEACLEQWYKYGMKCVLPTFGSYSTQRAADFHRLSPYGVYTADDCASDYKAWASQGTRNPCITISPPEVSMEKIGGQSGVTAMANIFRKQWPDQTGKPDPKDHTKWKPIDKWERAQLILIRDHDAQVK